MDSMDELRSPSLPTSPAASIIVFPSPSTLSSSSFSGQYGVQRNRGQLKGKVLGLREPLKLAIIRLANLVGRYHTGPKVGGRDFCFPQRPRARLLRGPQRDALQQRRYAPRARDQQEWQQATARSLG